MEGAIVENQKIFKPYKGNEPFIFVSYNHDDAEVVYRIITDLHERGYRIWHDNGISTGDNFVEALAKRIKDSEAVFCFLSPGYLDSPYCKRELTFALSNKKRVVPIKVVKFKLSDEVAFSLSGVNWTNLKNFPTEKDFVDHLCETNSDFMDVCRAGAPVESGKPIDPGVPPAPPVPPVPPKKNWKMIAVIAAVAAVLCAGIAIWYSTGSRTSAPAPAPVQSETSAASPSEAPEPAEKQTEVVSERMRNLPIVSEEDLSSSGQKAADYLAARVGDGCPVSVYDPEGSAEEEASFVYDNAVAALAFLAGNSGHKNYTGTQPKQILDTLVQMDKDGQASVKEADTEDLASAAIALLQYDRKESSASHVRAAQGVLDHILETRGRKEGGFSDRAGSARRLTADNLWLYAAFRMLAEKTGNQEYVQAADAAYTFLQSMRSSDGTYYLAAGAEKGGSSPEYVSVKVQALYMLIMNDQTGMKRALALKKDDGGYPPDDGTAGGFSTECTALMSLACQKAGLEEERAEALSAIYSCQLENGSIPAGTSVSLTDSEGETCPNVPKTSSAAWYRMAAAGYNPFLYE